MRTRVGGSFVHNVVRQKQPARGSAPRETYRFQLTPEDISALKDISAWFEQYGLDYAASCIVRFSFRSTAEMLKKVPLNDAAVKEIVRKIDLARGVTDTRER